MSRRRPRCFRRPPDAASRLRRQEAPWGVSERGCVRALGLAGLRGPQVTPAVCWPRPLLGSGTVAEAWGAGPPPVCQAVWQSCACCFHRPQTERVTGAEGAARDPHSDPGSNLFKSSRLRAFPGLDPRSQIPAWVSSTEPRGKGEEAPSSARWPPRGVPPALCSSGASSHLTTCLGMFTAAHGGPAARLECAGPG